MGIFSRSRSGRSRPGSADQWSLDRGVPVFEHPVHVLLHVLDHDWSLPGRHGRLVADVEPIGRPPYRADLSYDSDPDLVNGVVIGFPVPGLMDADDPGHIGLLEPPGGVDLPQVETSLANARVERDNRTLELLRRYPVPSAADLRSLLEPGGEVAAFEAGRFRLHLLTTVEATELLAQIDADDTAWQRARARLGMRHPLWNDNASYSAADALGHLDLVAPGGGTIDVQPLMDMLLGLRRLDRTPELAGSENLAVLMAPWARVLGPAW